MDLKKPLHHCKECRSTTEGTFNSNCDKSGAGNARGFSFYVFVLKETLGETANTFFLINPKCTAT